MKIAIAALISAIVTALLVFFFMNLQIQRINDSGSLERLQYAEHTVRKRLDDISNRIEFQLNALADVVASNKEFSLRLLVENDRSAPVVMEIASQFLKPMGFSVLEITDSMGVILSSGHFPANAGNRSVHKSGRFSDTAVATMENIRGTATLTLQAATGFSIAGFPFRVTGGLTIDNKFLVDMTPNASIKVLLKKGSQIIGMNDIRSISEITDHQIIINDKKYPAAEIEIPSNGIDEKISFIVIVTGHGAVSSR